MGEDTKTQAGVEFDPEKSETLAERVCEKTLADGTYLRVVAKVHYIRGNSRPHFSVTLDEWKSKRHYERGWENAGFLSGGIASEETVAEHFPDLLPVVRVHLSDDFGVPMHAVANGHYFYSGAAHEYERTSPYHGRPATDTPRERAARYLRIAEEDLPADGLDLEAFAEFCETLKPKWQAEAGEALDAIRGADHA